MARRKLVWKEVPAAKPTDAPREPLWRVLVSRGVIFGLGLLLLVGAWKAWGIYSTDRARMSAYYEARETHRQAERDRAAAALEAVIAGSEQPADVQVTSATPPRRPPSVSRVPLIVALALAGAGLSVIVAACSPLRLLEQFAHQSGPLGGTTGDNDIPDPAAAHHWH